MIGEEILNEVLLSLAKVIAHELRVLLESEASTREVNELFTKLVEKSGTTEYWISDESGKIEFTNRPDIEFSFDVDADAYGGQAAAFTPILRGETTSVVQPFMERTYDGKVFKYAAVCGYDKTRIVQVGISSDDANAPAIKSFLSSIPD